MEYLFDTNIFVESKKNLPMDIWPTFWTRMIGLIKSGNIHSIDKVKDEIIRAEMNLQIGFIRMHHMDFS